MGLISLSLSFAVSLSWSRGTQIRSLWLTSVISGDYDLVLHKIYSNPSYAIQSYLLYFSRYHQYPKTGCLNLRECHCTLISVLVKHYLKERKFIGHFPEHIVQLGEHINHNVRVRYCCSITFNHFIDGLSQIFMQQTCLTTKLPWVEEKFSCFCRQV